jgi:hypothetical protein
MSALVSSIAIDAPQHQITVHTLTHDVIQVFWKTMISLDETPEKSSPPQPLILIVYGATGFTGQLVATYLDAHLELRGKRWAIAGRTESKLADLSAKLGGRPETLCVDLEDPDAVSAMVARTAVVLNCAGPYSLYNGAALLGACARAGVHYSDLAGEGFWQAEMIEAFHDLAQESGAKVILGGGVDSIPSDLGAFVAAEALSGEPDQKVQLRGVYTRYTGSFSGGTLNSGKATARAKKSGNYTDAMEADPYLLAPGTAGVETGTPGTADGMAADFQWDFDSTYGVVSTFFMAPINARVVRRSLRYVDARGRNVGESRVRLFSGRTNQLQTNLRRRSALLVAPRWRLRDRGDRHRQREVRPHADFRTGRSRLWRDFQDAGRARPLPRPR